MNTEAVHTDAAFKAAQYVRMSTEHQQYSTHNQADKIKEYADKRGIEIVKTYADEGKSGLSIGDRAALQRLISDVENGLAEFNVILVYDVSRWGRFQDAATMSTSADVPAFKWPIVQSSSKTMAHLFLQSSKVSNAQWRGNTVASCPQRCSLGSAV